MPKFSIDWKETVYYNTVIEADTREEAMKIFHSVDTYGEVMDNDFEYVTRVEEIE